MSGHKNGSNQVLTLNVYIVQYGNLFQNKKNIPSNHKQIQVSLPEDKMIDEEEKINENTDRYGKIMPEWQCSNFLVRRWYGVVNIA